MSWPKKIGIYPWHQNQEINLLQSGQPFFDELLIQINKSKSEIHFHVYIFSNDETGNIVYQSLLAAAKRKVKIYLWLDAYGSNGFPRNWEINLIKEGGIVCFYSKTRLNFNIKIGVRLHHKIFVFDRSYAIIGGINISDDYSDFGSKKTWLDFGVSLKGNIVIDLLRICFNTEKKRFQFSRNYIQKYNNEKGLYQARVLQNHWLKAKFAIGKQYKQNIRIAQNEIMILTSYFLPSPALKRLLKNAAKRGVSVTLIVGSISDVGLVKFASQYFYLDLLNAGVKIVDWQPSVLHAKLAFIDSEWMCIGSYNLNHLSDFGSIECNIEIKNAEIQKKCKIAVNSILKNKTTIVSIDRFNQKMNFIKSIRNLICFYLINFSFKILFKLQKS